MGLDLVSLDTLHSLHSKWFFVDTFGLDKARCDKMKPDETRLSIESIMFCATH